MPNLVLVDKLRGLPAVSEAAKGRIIFGVDATASRQMTWDRAKVEQAKMFASVTGVKMQLVYYRGGVQALGLPLSSAECKHGRWVETATSLRKQMDTVMVAAGETQIERVLRHVSWESKRHPVAALMFVGDSVEEKDSNLYEAARAAGTRCFMFQEGSNRHTREVFSNIADMTGGAYAAFGESAAPEMGELMKAVAQYATGRLPPASGTPTYQLPKS